VEGSVPDRFFARVVVKGCPMRRLEFHEVQQKLHEEARTTKVAENLSTWVGPIVRYAELADLIVLARLDASGELQLAAMSGTPPLVVAAEQDERILIRFPQALANHIPLETELSGIVISPGELRRARINGQLHPVDGALEFACETGFTWCRKYITPSVSDRRDLHYGPVAMEARALDDADVVRIVSNALMSFVITATPDGSPYISHRGGEPGFLDYDPSARSIRWTEYLGDGLLLSAGNIRAAASFKLVALDLDSGDGVELTCAEAGYTNLRPSRQQRVDPLVQSHEPYAVQGKTSGVVRSARYLRQICHPRRVIERTPSVNACSAVDEQAPD
jgi:hypothetical protein